MPMARPGRSWQRGQDGGGINEVPNDLYKMHPLKMYFLLKMGIFHSYVSLPEGT